MGSGSLEVKSNHGERERTDLGCVVGRTEDQLRRPVVTRADVGDVGLVFNQNLGRSEIAQLQDTSVRVQQEVLGLDVAMTNSLGVDVGQRPEQLVDVELDLEHGHSGLEFVEVARGTVHGFRDILENQVEVHFIFLQWRGKRSVGAPGGRAISSPTRSPLE